MTFNSENIPLYIYDKKNKKYLRTLFEEKLNKHIIKETKNNYTFIKKILQLDGLSSSLIKMHLMYEIRNQDYRIIRNKFLCWI